MKKISFPGKQIPKRHLVFGITIVCIVLGAGTIYFYQRPQEKKVSPEVLSEKIKQDPLSLLDTLEPLIDIPKGEDPIIATVNNKETLPKEPFFSNAENGDKVILFPKSQFIVLYRPSENRVINAGAGRYEQPKQVVIATGSAEASVSGDKNIKSLKLQLQNQ